MAISNTREPSFDGRVAIVTGAGRTEGIGRAHSMLLASRGAKVVVNDLGVGMDGRGTWPGNAQDVVDEIVSAGGEAIADTHSVADERSAQAVVQTALDAWGKVDILINNAGANVAVPFEQMSSEDVHMVVGVNLYGSIWMCRAVWPFMQQANYGRIMNVASNAMWGGGYLAVYGAAKAGVFGLTLSLAIEGAPHNINVNVYGPRAATGQRSSVAEEYAKKEAVAKTKHVAIPTAYLVHEQCTVTGRYFELHAGRVRERFVSQTKGYTNPDFTVEDVRDNFDHVLDRSTAIPVDLERRYSDYLNWPRYSEEWMAKYSMSR